MTTVEKIPNDVTIAAMQDARTLTSRGFKSVSEVIGSLSHEQTVADAQATQTKYFAERLQGICHGAAQSAGWWTAKDGTPVTANPYAFSNKLMLVVSECAEAMEGDRKGLKDDKLPHRDMREVELADAVIRIFDMAGAYGMDLGGAIAEKMKFNAIRPDHKPEARAALGGKTY
jgi:NTP pyrophosphatase (non-canonical NTP hydrolase)